MAINIPSKGIRFEVKLINHKPLVMDTVLVGMRFVPCHMLVVDTEAGLGALSNLDLYF